MNQDISVSMKNIKPRLRILDTTLRDGDQSPGMAFSRAEKLEISLLLEKLGVDIIEAGFPASSPGEFAMVKEISSTIRTSAISAMARSTPRDIEKAAEAVKNAVRKHIHLTISTSPIHRKYKLMKSKEEILKMAVESVKHAVSLADSVEIGAEDSTRTEPGFLTEFCAAVTAAGAGTVNISDTVGFIQPAEFSRMIKRLIKEVPAFSNGSATVSIHCHNDLGMATANTLAGIAAGAMQAETTLLGIGERAGNAALEEIITAINVRDRYYPVTTGINPELFPEAARIISRANAIRPHPCKPIVGANIFSHSSGMHQHGMVHNHSTYSIIKPSISFPESRFVLSRHSGIQGIMEKARHLTGIEPDEETLERLFDRFKDLADNKKNVSSTEFLLLLNEIGLIKNTVWRLKKSFYFESKSPDRQEFSIFLELINQEGEEKRINENASGKWIAVKKALDTAFHLDLKIIDFSSSIYSYKNVISERFRIEAEFEGNFYADESFGNDSVILFIECYLNIANQIIAKYQLSGSE